MPSVEVYLYAMLRHYQPALRHGEPARVELAPGATVENLLAALGIPAEETKAAFVNGISRGPEWTLAEGDRVAVFPPIAGGQSRTLSAGAADNHIRHRHWPSGANRALSAQRRSSTRLS